MSLSASLDRKKTRRNEGRTDGWTIVNAACDRRNIAVLCIRFKALGAGLTAEMGNACRHFIAPSWEWTRGGMKLQNEVVLWRRYTHRTYKVHPEPINRQWQEKGSGHAVMVVLLSRTHLYMHDQYLCSAAASHCLHGDHVSSLKIIYKQ